MEKGERSDMFVSICCSCNLIMKLQEEEEPGLVYSHGYCKPCGAEELRKIEREYASESKIMLYKGVEA
jgi:hypothetical protein